jgi:hypothetical protein
MGTSKTENDMNTGKAAKELDAGATPATVRGLSVTALVLGVLGGAFYWWLPMGMVLSLAGFMFGIVDWTAARRRSLDYRLSVVAILLSVATLALDIVIAYLGLQIWTFGGQ